MACQIVETILELSPFLHDAQVQAYGDSAGCDEAGLRAFADKNIHVEKSTKGVLSTMTDFGGVWHAVS